MTAGSDRPKRERQLSPQIHALMQGIFADIPPSPALLGITRMLDRATRDAEASLAKMRPIYEWMEAQAAQYQARWDRAVAGDNEALVRLLVDNGFAMLDDEPIRKRIDELRNAPEQDRNVLDRIAMAIRRSLLEPRKRGRRANTQRRLVKRIDAVQSAYQEVRGRLKPSYRNDGARLMAIREVSSHIASAVADEDRAAVAKAAEQVLVKSKKRPGVGFGAEVVAKALSRSSRHIRSIRSK